MIILYITDTSGKITIVNNIPIAAHSIVPTVDGEENLFWVKLCIINPDIAIPAPTIRILNNLGNLLIKKISISLALHQSILNAPIESDNILKAIKTIYFI